MKLIENPNPGNKWYYCADCHKTFQEDEWYKMDDHRHFFGHEIRKMSARCRHITIKE